MSAEFRDTRCYVAWVDTRTGRSFFLCSPWLPERARLLCDLVSTASAGLGAHDVASHSSGAIAVGDRSFPEVRSTINMFFELSR